MFACSVVGSNVKPVELDGFNVDRPAGGAHARSTSARVCTRVVILSKLHPVRTRFCACSCDLRVRSLSRGWCYRTQAYTNPKSPSRGMLGAATSSVFLLSWNSVFTRNRAGVRLLRGGKQR